MLRAIVIAVLLCQAAWAPSAAPATRALDPAPGALFQNVSDGADAWNAAAGRTPTAGADGDARTQSTVTAARFAPAADGGGVHRSIGARTGILVSGGEERARAQAAAPAGTLTRGGMTVHYDHDGKRLAQRILDLAGASLEFPALPRAVVRDGGPVHIFLAPDPAAFDTLTGGRVPEWGAGVAFPAAGRIVLPAYASSRAAPHQLGRILRHELAHIALHRYLAPARIPRWFDEGYARWAAGEWSWQAAWQLRLAFALHRAPPLDSLALAWPVAEVDARVAYLLATSTVAFLVERSQVRGLRIFLERWAAHGALEPALRRTYGLTLGQFEEDWREDVKDSYGWAFLLSYSLVFWLFVAVALLGLYAIRRRRDRARRSLLRATDPPDDPAYWLD